MTRRVLLLSLCAAIITEFLYLPGLQAGTPSINPSPTDVYTQLGKNPTPMRTSRPEWSNPGADERGKTPSQARIGRHRTVISQYLPHGNADRHTVAPSVTRAARGKTKYTNGSPRHAARADPEPGLPSGNPRLEIRARATRTTRNRY